MKNNIGAIVPQESDAPARGEITAASSNESAASTDGLKPEAAQEQDSGPPADLDVIMTAEKPVSDCGVESSIALSKQDITLRENLERDVTNGRNALVTMARSFYKLVTHDNGALFKQLGYKSAEEYGAAVWGFGRAQVLRLLEAGRFMADLENYSAPQGAEGLRQVKMPVNEAQVRALASVPAGKRIECWVSIVAELDPEELTGPIVREEAKGYLRRKKLQPSPKSVAAQKIPATKRAQKKIKELGQILADLPDPEKFEPLVQLLGELVSTEPQHDTSTVEDVSSPVDVAESGPIDPGVQRLLIGKMPFRDLYLLHLRQTRGSAPAEPAQVESEVPALAMA